MARKSPKSSARINKSPVRRKRSKITKNVSTGAADIVLLGQLPQALIDEILESILLYAIGFVRVETVGRFIKSADLLGSGTLVQIGENFAILTAHHVLEVLPRKDRIGLLLDKTGSESGPYTIDTAGLDFLKIGRGDKDEVGPDLGAVLLSPSIAASLGSKKSFFSLGNHREKSLTDPPKLKDGVWVVQGVLEERTAERVEGDKRIRAFYSYSAFGGPSEEAVVRGEYDYFEFQVDTEGRAQAPKDWGGVSGGGLWQVPLKRNKEQQLVAGRAVLSGVAFYQVDTTPTTCGVRCHARRSIYDKVYSAISTTGH